MMAAMSMKIEGGQHRKEYGEGIPYLSIVCS